MFIFSCARSAADCRLRSACAASADKLAALLESAMKRWAVFCGAAVFLLSACGQTGPLYLPDHAPGAASQKPAVTPTPQPTPTPAPQAQPLPTP
jgi:predicted small lipoprotein YifL